MLSSSFAQGRKIEFSTYGGWKNYNKIECRGFPYPSNSGFGLGVQFKYNITPLFFWAVDLNGGTDDDTVNKVDDRLVSSYRRDFNLSTGLGVNILHEGPYTLYLQALVGIGHVGWSKRWVHRREPEYQRG